MYTGCLLLFLDCSLEKAWEKGAIRQQQQYRKRGFRCKLCDLSQSFLFCLSQCSFADTANTIWSCNLTEPHLTYHYSRKTACYTRLYQSITLNRAGIFQKQPFLHSIAIQNFLLGKTSSTFLWFSTNIFMKILFRFLWNFLFRFSSENSFNIVIDSLDGN